MSISHTVRQEIRVEQRLTCKQSIKVQTEAFNSRMALMEALHGIRYEPHAGCPNCGYKLSPLEIIKGFNQDPQDFTTACPKCKHRFMPKLINFGLASKVEMPFYCAVQTLEQLQPDMLKLNTDQLQQQHRAIFHSAMVHFGTIKNAFAKKGMIYPFDQIHNWAEKIKPFLGKLPDTVIAKCADKNPKTIRKLRHKLGIEAYSARNALAEIED